MAELNVWDGILDTTRFQEEATLKRLGKFALRGATLGSKGATREAETFGEHAAEFVGGIVPVAAISAIASPAVGAGLKALRFPKVALPLTSRLTTGGLVQAGVSTGYDVAEKGEVSLGDVATSFGIGAAQEGLFLGAGKLIGKARARYRKIPGQTEPSPAASAVSESVNEITKEVPSRRLLALPPKRDGDVLPSTGVKFEVPPESGFQYTKRTDEPATFERFGTVIKKGTGRFAEEGTDIIVEPKPVQALFGKTATGKLQLRASQLEQTKEKFHIGRDPESKLPELISKDDVTDSAIKTAERSWGSSEPTVQKVTNPKVIQQLDLKAKTTPLQTSNILKQPEETAKKLLETETPPKIVDYTKMTLTPEGAESMILMKQLGIDDKTVNALMDAAAQIKNPAERLKLIKDQLRRLCGGS